MATKTYSFLYEAEWEGNPYYRVVHINGLSHEEALIHFDQHIRAEEPGFKHIEEQMELYEVEHPSQTGVVFLSGRAFYDPNGEEE